ncbi:hypothetical protein [Nocardia bovistercoris]|uniref:Uncharacterized protein n=1 Tax=Nocardia bovistercoris TaxID=2785916 RepID=A0A931I7U0_9NOCA|nr:hypothetical protein [Nocardia bovistercoris]MBH0776459.1 hypothetical protein [Nocardia bovistercoris]
MKRIPAIPSGSVWTPRVVRIMLCPMVVVTVLAGAMFGAGPAAAASDGIRVAATVDDRDIGPASSRAPLRLVPDSTVRVAVTVTNNTRAQLELRRVDLTGRVLGLNFFSYSTAVGLKIAPGSTETLRYQLDLAGLRGQATGLIGGRLGVIGLDGKEVAGVDTVTDVRGSIWSVFGLFGIALAVLTALATLDATLGIARHRLSANRWQRGVRLLAPGVGIGLIFGFTASVLRWWVPSTGMWLTVAACAAAVGFLLGYLSPTPESESDGDPADELLDLSDADVVDTVRLVPRGPDA